MSKLDELVDRARGPAGQARVVDFDADTGPLAEVAALLTRVNGFFAFNAGIQVFHAGAPGIGPELEHWNRHDTWKHTYGTLADNLFCFGQDLFGVQYAVEGHQHVVTFNPETAERTRLGTSLEDWAAWLLDDPDIHGCRAFATTWQDDNRPLTYSERLLPWRPFVLGGTYEPANLTVKEATEAMLVRGPIAQTVHTLPEGAELHLKA